MTRDIGNLKYFILRKADLNGLTRNDFLKFKIKNHTYKILVSVILDRFKKSVDWNKNGVHKQSSSVPKWIINANEF